MSVSLLRLHGLEVNYGAVRALRGVSLSIEPGAMIALLGSNGSGKSTTLKAISGMVKPVAGQIEYQGQSTSGKSRIAWFDWVSRMCPKAVAFFKDLAVLENLRMGAYTRNDADGIAEDLAMVFDLFPAFK